MRIQDRILFVKRLAFLLEAGVSLYESIGLLHTQTMSRGEKQLLHAVHERLSEGSTLAEALIPFRSHFGDFTINMIRIGETTGTLSQNLNHLAHELGKKYRLRRTVLGALIYPACITLVTLITTTLLIVFIFPKITPLFTSLHIEIPFITRILLSISILLIAHGGLIFVSTVLSILGGSALYHYHPRVRPFVFRVLVRVPILGSLLTRYYTAHLCRTLGLTHGSGIPLSAALTITHDAIDAPPYRALLNRMITHTAEGGTLYDVLKTDHVLVPPLARDLIAVGERTGKLTDTCMYLGTLYEEEVTEEAHALSQTLEPLLLTVMGVLIGLIAVSVIMPIYEVTKYLGNR